MSATHCNKILKSRKHHLYGCAWNVAIEWVYLIFLIYILTMCKNVLNAQVFYQGCGRNSENQHAIKHFETPHSDPHCLVISLDNWSVWWACYCVMLVTDRSRVHCKWSPYSSIFFSFVAKPPGVTYVMMKSSTPELGIWLSWWPTLKNKPLLIPRRQYRRVGPVRFVCFYQLELLGVFLYPFLSRLFRSEGGRQLSGSWPEDQVCKIRR